MKEFDELIEKLKMRPRKEQIEKLRGLVAKMREQDRQWFCVTLEAIHKHTERHQSREFTRRVFYREELERIREKTGTRGKTPERTLDRTIQDLRDAGLVDFVDYKGTYRLKS